MQADAGKATIRAMTGRAVRDKPTVPVSFKLPRAVYEKLKAIAVRDDRSMAAIALRALEAYCANPPEVERIRAEAQDRPK